MAYSEAPLLCWLKPWQIHSIHILFFFLLNTDYHAGTLYKETSLFHIIQLIYVDFFKYDGGVGTPQRLPLTSHHCPFPVNRRPWVPSPVVQPSGITRAQTHLFPVLEKKKIKWFHIIDEKSHRVKCTTSRLVPPSWRTGKHHSAKSQCFCCGTTVVEWAPGWCQDGRFSHQLPQETQDPPAQSSPGLFTFPLQTLTLSFVFVGLGINSTHETHSISIAIMNDRNMLHPYHHVPWWYIAVSLNKCTLQIALHKSIWQMSDMLNMGIQC